MREVRQKFNEDVLETDRVCHHMATAFINIVYEEAQLLLRNVGSDRTLDWDAFLDSWYRIVWRVIFCDHARVGYLATGVLTALLALFILHVIPQFLNIHARRDEET